MGNIQSKDSPYYGTAAITGTTGGVFGAAAVCIFIFALPISLATVVIGGTAGLTAGLVTEHIWPSDNYAKAALKCGIIGFITGGSVYYASVKLAPDYVLSTKQLNVISKRAQAMLDKNPNIKPTKLKWKQNSPTYAEHYKIKDPKTSYVVDLSKQKNAIEIKLKYNPVSGTPKALDVNHTYLEISDGNNTFITELTGAKGAGMSTGGVVENATRDGTMFNTYYANPNKCRTLEQAKQMVMEAKKPWDQKMMYNGGDATCQHYSRDIIHVMTDISKADIPLKEKNTFKVVKTFDGWTRNVFNGNTTATHKAKDTTLRQINGHPRKLTNGISNNAGNSYGGAVVFGAVTMTAGVVGYKARRRHRVQS